MVPSTSVVNKLDTSFLCLGMCMDMCMDMCMYMCEDMCMDMCMCMEMGSVCICVYVQYMCIGTQIWTCLQT